MLFKLILIVQVISALAVIVLVLLQQGKGADAGAAFGGGSAMGAGGSSSFFGASGSGNFLAKITAALAAVFFLATLAMAYFGPYRAPSQNSVIEKLQNKDGASAEQKKAEQPDAKDATGAGAVPGAKAGSQAPLGTVPAKK